MTRKAEREKLRATAEELLGYSKPLDLLERETLNEVRMDRAERRARERAEGTNRTEEQIQRRAKARRGVWDIVTWAGRMIGMALAGRAVKEVNKRL